MSLSNVINGFLFVLLATAIAGVVITLSMFAWADFQDRKKISKNDRD